MRRREFLHALAIGAGAGWITKFAQSGGGKRMADRSVVVDTSKSPHAKLRSIPISAVKLRDRFWQPRLIALQEVTIPTQYELMEQTGRIDNFRRVAGKVGGEFRGLYFNDSDVYKWLEAAAWSLAVQPNEKVADLSWQSGRRISRALFQRQRCLQVVGSSGVVSRCPTERESCRLDGQSDCRN